MKLWLCHQSCPEFVTASSATSQRIESLISGARASTCVQLSIGKCQEDNSYGIRHHFALPKATPFL